MLTSRPPLSVKKKKVWSGLDWLCFAWLGFVVGQAGLYQGIAMFLVAYFIICMTVLSVCAISTNGALDAGGAYCILLIHVYNADAVVGFFFPLQHPLSCCSQRRLGDLALF